MSLITPSLVLRLLLAVLLLQHVQAQPDDDYDDESDFKMLISGGYRPKRHTFAKYVVSIRTEHITAYFGDNHFCAGAIIAKTVVITAAHCVVDSNRATTRAKRLKVVIGTPNRLRKDTNTVEMDVETVLPHEHFARAAKYDIALLRLKVAIPNGNIAVNIISLAAEEPIANANCTTVGWGQLFEDGPYSADAVYVQLFILKKAICSAKYPVFGEGMICAGDPSDWYRDVCRGDSGGPLFCNGRLAGIASWGMNSVVKNMPTVFTDVFHYRRWIQDVSGAPAGADAAAIDIVVLGLFLTCIC